MPPTVADRPPRGEGWAHELKHDGYRLQIHVRDGRVRLYTMNGNDWTKRYPHVVVEAARLKGAATHGFYSCGAVSALLLFQASGGSACSEQLARV